MTQHRARVWRGLCIGGSAWILAAALPAGAATYYVRSSGSDANDGASPSTALGSIGAAAQHVMNPGDTVIVGPGRYPEGNISPTHGGVPGRPVRFIGDASGTSTGDPPGPVLVDVPQVAQPPQTEPPGAGFLLFGTSNVVVSGFYITGAMDAGIQVRPNVAGTPSDQAVIANNVIFSNGLNGIGRGVQVDDSKGTLVFNNLIYANTSVGVSIGGTTVGSPDARVINNTVYANAVAGIVVGTGVVSGTGSTSVSPGAWVLNNVIFANGVGLDVGTASVCNYVGAFNLVMGPPTGGAGVSRCGVTDGYSTTTPCDPSDIHLDPAFVQPAGADGILGGAGFADDNFALSAPAAGQTALSPAVDAGSEPAALFGLDHATTRTDGQPDASLVDLGFHAGNVGYPTLQTLPVEPQTLYVRAGGSDGNNGLQPAAALATIGHAAEIARAQTQIVVGPGTYKEADIGIKKLKPAGLVSFVADASGVRTGDVPGPVVVNAGGGDTGFVIVGRCSTVIDGFTVTNAATAGIQVRSGSHQSVVRNNVAFSNRRLGVQVTDSNMVEVLNNLSYANGTGGVQVGGDVGSDSAVVENNTCYSNGFDGILIGAGSAPSANATVQYNIMQDNAVNGIQLDDNTTVGKSQHGYTPGFNLNADAYGAGTPRPASDLTAPESPLFVNPAGADGILGGAGFADDDFHLSQIAAGQTEDSPAVDYAPVTAALAELDNRSTRSDGVVDMGLLDLGYHYPVLGVLYVSPNGSDDNSGRTADRPLATIGKALQQARAGGQIVLAPGTYAEAGLEPPAGVSIEGEGGGLAVIDAGGESAAFEIHSPGVSISAVGVTGARRAGVAVFADDFRLTDARIFGNGGTGVLVGDSHHALILNNVISANGAAGIALGVGANSAAAATVMQNTIAGNGGRGVMVGVATRVASTGAAIVNNVVSDNGAEGIEIGPGSDTGLLLSHNCNADGYKGAAPGQSDIQADPLLVAPPGGSGAAEDPSGDAFYLAQAAAGQVMTSPCVDAGFGSPQRLGMQATWTRTDAVADQGRIDIGYHHGAPDLVGIDVAALVRTCVGDCVDLVGDCNQDGRVTVNEVIRGVSIALGTMPLSLCPSFDRSGTGKVTIADVIAAVHVALGG